MARSFGTSSAASPSADTPPPEPGLAGAAPLVFLRVRVRLTGAGGTAVLLLLAAGVVAVNAANNLLYLVVAALLALLTLSGLLAFANLRGLAVRALQPEEVYAGRPATVELEIHNARRMLPAYLLSAGGDADLPLVEIAPGERARMPFTLSFPRRGRQPFPERSVLSDFPFGLVRRGGTFIPPGSCVVYPRPLPLPWELVERAEREGEHLSRHAPGVGGDYRGARDYVAGDSLTRVQWKSWLRLRRFQTKEFEAEGVAPVTFAWEDVPGPGVEERLGQLAWLVRSALRRGRSVGLALPGRTIPPGSGPSHRRTLLEALALFGETA